MFWLMTAITMLTKNDVQNKVHNFAPLINLMMAHMS
jgi:hypothetical protein